MMGHRRPGPSHPRPFTPRVHGSGRSSLLPPRPPHPDPSDRGRRRDHLPTRRKWRSPRWPRRCGLPASRDAQPRAGAGGRADRPRVRRVVRRPPSGSRRALRAVSGRTRRDGSTPPGARGGVPGGASGGALRDPGRLAEASEEAAVGAAPRVPVFVQHLPRDAVGGLPARHRLHDPRREHRGTRARPEGRDDPAGPEAPSFSAGRQPEMGAADRGTRR